MVDELSPEEIDRAIKEYRLLLVDAWAPSCAPCRELGPILEELEDRYEGNSDLRIVKVNTQEHIGFAIKNNIFAIPCVLAFFEGKPAEYVRQDPETGDTKVVDRLLGLRPLEHYDDIVCSLLCIT